MSNDNEVPGSMVIVAQGPDDQYAYEVPPIDSAAVAGNMFGDLILIIQSDLFLNKEQKKRRRSTRKYLIKSMAC
ncbi:hypothetical protein M0418_05095 [Pseudomonas aeruginosa]|nr:hypothetical protein [Pseudomonas aeruginosa]USV16226.1 hypothetical protein M0418_05095 [Pseudomonas aeruginosa]